MIITQLPNQEQYIVHCKGHTTLHLTTVPAQLKKIIFILEENSSCTFILASNHSWELTLAVELNGRNAHFNGLICLFLKDTTEVNLTTYQQHNAPDTTSKITVKSVLYDKARSIYNGTITIGENAAQTNASQNSYALLLSPDAQAYAHPSLEVLNHEVQCNHGAAVGSLDEEHLFYLNSRGIDITHAEKLIVQSFFSELQDYPHLWPSTMPYL